MPGRPGCWLRLSVGQSHLVVERKEGSPKFGSLFEDFTSLSGALLFVTNSPNTYGVVSIYFVIRCN